jgi:ectoine hydroxylase-related dioxygenase (phytanoyl-CoA dioxygenase family)
MSEPSFHPPFPALTPSQRYHLDVFGYVIVPDVLTREEIGRTLEALQKLKRDLQAIEDPKKRVIRHAYFETDQPHHHYLGAISQADPAITAYITHPRVVGMAEEFIGGKAHILEANAHINRKAPSWDMGEDGEPRYGFHRGLPPYEGNHIRNGLYHSSFVKVLTNLTDLGPDDGGTVVVAGSHKIDAADQAIIKAAYEERSLIHQVIAPAGSSLLFSEALLHATGRITSDKERVIVICGYGRTWFPWKFMESHRPDFVLEAEFIESIPEPLRYLFVSQGYIQRTERYRDLNDPMDELDL